MNVSNTSRLVVGDRFCAFAAAVGGDTFSTLAHSLDAGDLDSVQGPVHIVTGQGIGPYEADYLRDAIARRGLDGRVVLAHTQAELARKQDLHKAREDNVLVAGLTPTGDRTYEALLRLHDHNELLADVQGRVHVQGMVTIEAARQMSVAVAERFYTARWSQQRYYIVINSIATSFTNFLFPVAATLRLTVDSSDVSQPEQLAMTVTVEVVQASRTAASVAVNLTAFAPGLVEDKELRRAKNASAAAVEAALGDTV